MSKCSKPIHKKIRIRKDFVLNGQNVFEGDFLEERDINREFQGKMQGLIRRGFIEVWYEEPKPEEPANPACKPVDCIEQKLECSEKFEVQPDCDNHSHQVRDLKQIEVSLKDQALIDQAEASKEKPRRGRPAKATLRG
jgi:hypothetical protein|nr:MAG TPA: hypothetical protein [Caudoviricetes sp.]